MLKLLHTTVKNSIRDAHNPKNGEIAFNYIHHELYIRGETVQRLKDFQNRQCKLCKGTKEITLYVKIKYLNTTI